MPERVHYFTGPGALFKRNNQDEEIEEVTSTHVRKNEKGCDLPAGRPGDHTLFCGYKIVHPFARFSHFVPNRRNKIWYFFEDILSPAVIFTPFWKKASVETKYQLYYLRISSKIQKIWYPREKTAKGCNSLAAEALSEFIPGPRRHLLSPVPNLPA